LAKAAGNQQNKGNYCDNEGLGAHFEHVFDVFILK
jgi:hypothetical protein